MLEELLRSCGKEEEETEVDFALFARAVALILEENLEADIGEGDEEEEEGDYMEMGDYEAPFAGGTEPAESETYE